MFRYLTTSIQAMHRNPETDGRRADIYILAEFEVLSKNPSSSGEFALTIEETEALIVNLAKSVKLAKDARELYENDAIFSIRIVPKDTDDPLGKGQTEGLEDEVSSGQSEEA